VENQSTWIEFPKPQVLVPFHKATSVSLKEINKVHITAKPHLQLPNTLMVAVLGKPDPLPITLGLGLGIGLGLAFCFGLGLRVGLGLRYAHGYVHRA
jgi:hypothetical protein